MTALLTRIAGVLALIGDAWTVWYWHRQRARSATEVRGAHAPDTRRRTRRTSDSRANRTDRARGPRE